MDAEGEDEGRERHHGCREESGKDPREMVHIGVYGTPLTRPKRKVQMQVQVDMPVLLLLLMWVKTLAVALRLIL